MEFKKIQLNGFKSFADKTNFLIEEGLTGIVGPNGCGKSNIVESLRWCMGETSAKSMRGSGMEDVIFSGTSNKPSKNIAEVSIGLSNDSKEGPLQYKDLDEIQIRRKIEKDKGSKFYINDKEVRAKDAQMFFADLSTGAHSPSIISQGRIGALVTAKPTDRRAVLEEAAGIAGLHVRRHEAELRLDAAENNLKRADELRRQQERQLQNLLKQAEEATKYKNISEDIKKIEAGLYYLKLRDIDNEIKLEKEINNEADNEVKGFNEKLELIQKKINDETEKVNPIRDKNFEILSKIQRLNLELKGLDEENLNNSNDTEIPVLGKIAAGTPVEAIQNEVSRIPLPANIEKDGEFFGLKVQGDSMIEAGINDGDTVIVKKADTADNGKIVVALIDDHEAMLKRIRRKGKTVALESANRNYETKIFGPDRVKVQGILVSLYRNFQ